MRYAIALSLILPLALAGCADPGQAVPQAARLSEEALVVSLSDGTRCTADWRGAPTGALTGCPGFEYRVAVVETPNLLRQLMDGITDALKADGVLAPMAEVTVMSGNKRWRFVSPPPAE